MITQVATFIVFVAAFASVAYAMLTFEWLCGYLKKHFPEYYEAAGRPQILNGFSFVRYSRGSRLFTKFIYGSIPEGFPRDKMINRRVSAMQTAMLIFLLSWLLFVFLMFRNMANQ